MKTPQIILVCLSLLAGYIAATALNRPSSAQHPAPQLASQEVVVGRYQLTVPIEGRCNGDAFLTDTATGHCWRRIGNGNTWEDWGSPTERKAQG
jgi:hypothetical protein